MKQSLIIILLTIVVVLGGNLIGLKLLEMIYGISLEEWRGVFLRLLAFGGVAALAYYLNTILTIFRKQFYIMLGYGFAFVVNVFATRSLVRDRGITGAALAYGLIVVSILLSHYRNFHCYLKIGFL